MKHPFRKLLALGLSVILTTALLPAASATQITGAALRSAAAAQAQAIATVPWTMETRLTKASIVGDRLDAFTAGGILPTTFFEYIRLYIPHYGVMVESNNGTLEAFTAQLDYDASKVNGYGHLYNRAIYAGMDVNGFLADVIARVSPTKITSLKQALTDPSLEALLPGANLSASNSRFAIGAADANAAYDKLGTGDLLLAWDNNAAAGEDGKPRIHAMVVQSVDTAKDTVTVTYPNYALLVYHFECDKCGATSTEGPTSAALPEHVNSVNYAFGSYKKHSDTQSGISCDGTWKPICGTSWTTATVSYTQLAQTGVPYGSVGYLPYTLDVYSAPVEPKVTLNTSATADTLASGFSGTITSNYRIAAVEAVLTPKGGESQSYICQNLESSWSMDYNDINLSKALMDSQPGDYELEVKVRLGNTNQKDSPFAPISIYKQSFTMSPSAFHLSCDKTRAEQGEPFTLSVNTLEGGFTAVSALIKSDSENYVFDLAASKAASPNVTFTQTKDGSISFQYKGSALAAGSTAAKLVFAPHRTGGWGYSEGIEPFLIANVLASKQSDGSNLTGARVSGGGFVVAVGLNTQVFRNFIKGYDLVLAYMHTPEMAVDQSNSTLPMAYDGQPMYDVTFARYKIGVNTWLRTYAIIVPNADMSKVALGTETCPVLTFSDNVNEIGGIDIADVQTIANIRAGRVPLEGNINKWLRADVDRNGVVDTADQTALMNIMCK